MIAVTSRVNVDFLLCPTDRLRMMLLYYVYPIESDVHSFRTVVLIVVMVATVVFMNVVTAIARVSRTRAQT